MAEKILAETARQPDSTRSVIVVCPDQLGPAVGRALSRRSPSGWPRVVPFPTAGNPDLVDWVDYKERNADADPAKFVADLNATLPAGTTVFLAANNSYKTFEGKCEGVAAALAKDRDPQLLLTGDGDNFFEAFSLTAFRPRA